MTSEFEILWQQVETMPNPGPAPAPEEPSISLHPDVRRLKRLLDIRLFALALLCIGYPVGALLSFWEAAPVMLWTVALLTSLALFIVIVIPTDTTAFKERLDAAEAYWNYIRSEWEESAGPKDLDISELRLLAIRNKWKSLQDRERQKIEDLKENQREAQLMRFLMEYRIEDAKIFNIGDDRGKSLQQAKIRTAADITAERLSKVQGIGPTLTRALLDWRKTLEQQFQYDPSQPISEVDIERIHAETAAEAKELELELNHRLADHRRILARIQKVRATGLPLLNSAYRTYRLALIEMAAVGRS